MTVRCRAERWLLAGGALLLLAATAACDRKAATPAPSYTVEKGVDRRGKGRTLVILTKWSEEACARRCSEDPACDAWTLYRAEARVGYRRSTGGTTYRREVRPNCLLLEVVGPPKPDRCCVSGIKTLK